MPFILMYLLKLSISIAAVFLFYYLFLRRLTFYNWNRLYLLVYTIISFPIAYINIEPALQRDHIINDVWAKQLPHVAIHYKEALSQGTVTSSTVSWNIYEWLIYFILTGMAIMALRLTVQFFAVWHMTRKAEHYSENGISFYHVKENIIPFSFGNAVFVNKDLHSPDDLEKIVFHEFVHVRQKHSIDTVWAELLCLLNWYNPFAWLIRKAIRENLEFIADNKVLQTGIAKKEYQYLLLKVAGNNQISITHKFNFSSLKKRIKMMNKIKTTKIHLTKFLFSLPLAALLLISFRENEINEPADMHQTLSQINQEDRLWLKLSPGNISAKDQWIGLNKPNVYDSVFSDGKANQILINSKKTSYNPINKALKESPYEKNTEMIQSPSFPDGFTGIEGVTHSGEGEVDITPGFTYIKGKICYYTETGNKRTYYNRYGQQIDINGKVLITIQTNASDVLPNQYILKVYKDGALICEFKNNK